MSAATVFPSRRIARQHADGRSFAVRRKRSRWQPKILALLEPAGTALTTRQVAERLACYPGSLTHAVLELRRADQLIEAGQGIDPATGRKASCWASVESAKAAARRA